MLTLTLVCVGRLKAGPDRDLAERYIERARQAARPLGLEVDLREIAESKCRRPLDRKAEEAAALRQVAGEAARLVVFDETGRSIDSLRLAEIVRVTRDEGAGALTFVIGGPDGLHPTIRDDATHVIALGAMTWPHRLVRIMVAEQIYRTMTILSGHPYHRS